MTVIHMDTDLVQPLVIQIRSISKVLELGWRDLFVATNQLDWSGNSRDEFVEKLRYGGRHFYEILEDVEMLANRLDSEIKEWEEKGRIFGMKLGPTNDWLNNNANEWGNNVWIDSAADTRLADTFAWFSTSDEGRKLISSAIAAGLMFVIMKDGIAVGWLGAPGGKQIPIEWENMEGARGFYSPDFDNEYIGLNDGMQSDNHIYQHTLAHEMQHAIDFNSDALDQQALNNFNSLDQYSVKNMSIEDVEVIMGKGLDEYVKSEINAHGRGYAINPDLEIGKMFVNNDGDYSYIEKSFILGYRGYEKSYETALNEMLKNLYGPNTNFRANVWLDLSGNVRVDLNQGTMLNA